MNTTVPSGEAIEASTFTPEEISQVVIALNGRKYDLETWLSNPIRNSPQAWMERDLKAVTALLAKITQVRGY